MITKQELGKCLGCSDRTLQHMVERFEIPPPMTLGGRKVWIVGKSGHGSPTPPNAGKPRR
jgi:hypothetical protein